MKKDDLLTHLSFLGVLMTMAVFSAPVDAGPLNSGFTESDNLTSHFSGQVFSNASQAAVFELGSADAVSSKAFTVGYSLVVNNFK